jgi:tetratricopeptide (TPR) repeat protein
MNEASRDPGLDSPKADRGKTQHLILAHLVFILSAMVYAGSLNNDFVWRDKDVIVANRWVRTLSGASAFFHPGFWAAEMEGVIPGYKPVLLFSYSLDFSVWRDDALGFHLTNLFLHSLASVLVFFLCRRLVQDDGLAFFGGLLFAFHPAAAEAVCYLSERASLLGWFLVLASWLSWWRSWENGSPRGLKKGSYGMALLLNGLAVGTFSAAAVLPILQGIALSFRKRTLRGSSRLWLGLLPFLALSLAGLILSGSGAGAVEGFYPYAASSQPFSFKAAAAALGNMARIVFFPIGLVAQRPLSFGGSAFLGLGILALAGAFLAFGYRRYPKAAFGLALLVVALAPALFRVALKGEAFGEHHLYGAAAGFSLLVLGLIHDSFPLEKTSSGSASHRLILASLVALGVAFASLTAKRHMAWETPLSITQDTAASMPENPWLRSHEARLWLEKGDVEAAEAILEQLKGSLPSEPEVLLALEAELALARGRPDEASRALRKAYDLKPSDSLVASRLAGALLEAGRLDEAEELLHGLEPLERKPELLYLRGRLAERRGRLAEALDFYTKATALAPHREDYHLARGLAAQALGKPKEAEEALRTALREGPGLLDAYGALAHLLLSQGRSREVIYMLASVVRWNPQRADLGLLLAQAWSRQGRPRQAHKLVRRLLEDHPDDPAVRRAARGLGIEAGRGASGRSED